jgi:hypothetical protein
LVAGVDAGRGGVDVQQPLVLHHGRKLKLGSRSCQMSFRRTHP